MTEHNVRYILKGRIPVPCKGLARWGRWMSRPDIRQVGKDVISQAPEIMVSTVFLGIDHSFGRGEPKLFETMTFGGEYDHEIERCSTWEQAELTHKFAVERAKRSFLASGF